MGIVIFSGCKAVQKKETPKVPPATVDLQPIMDWKTKAPLENSDIFQYENSIPIPNKIGQKILTGDKNIPYKFVLNVPLYYIKYLRKVFKPAPIASTNHMHSMNLFYYMTFYTTETNGIHSVTLLLRVDAGLHNEGKLENSDAYSITNSVYFIPVDGDYPPLALIRELYNDSFQKLAKCFEDDPWWREVLD